VALTSRAASIEQLHLRPPRNSVPAPPPLPTAAPCVSPSHRFPPCFPIPWLSRSHLTRAASSSPALELRRERSTPSPTKVRPLLLRLLNLVVLLSGDWSWIHAGRSQGRRGGVPERRGEGGGDARREAGGGRGRRPPEAPRGPHAAAQEARHPLQACKSLIYFFVLVPWFFEHSVMGTYGRILLSSVVMLQ
jgi:hypothetical protein